MIGVLVSKIFNIFEMEEYLQLLTIILKKENGSWESFDPLQWWIANAIQFPRLAKMAFDILSTLVMSAEAE